MPCSTSFQSEHLAGRGGKSKQHAPWDVSENASGVGTLKQEAVGFAVSFACLIVGASAILEFQHRAPSEGQKESPLPPSQNEIPHEQRTSPLAAKQA